jgi:hypothetical protein
VATKNDGESAGAAPYLGALYSLGGHTIYGYVTSTNKRLLLALQQGAERIQDALVVEVSGVMQGRNQSVVATL